MEQFEIQTQASSSKRPYPAGAEPVNPYSAAKRPATSGATFAEASLSAPHPPSTENGAASINSNNGIGAAGYGTGAPGSVGEGNGADLGLGLGLGGEGASIADDCETKAVGKGVSDPDLKILEVTNDGGPSNMEMLIHLKVLILRIHHNSMFAPLLYVQHSSITNTLEL